MSGRGNRVYPNSICNTTPARTGYWPGSHLRPRPWPARPFDEDRLRRIFLADTFWAVAAGLWIITGLIRAFTGLEKGSAYYLSNSYFLIKMALLGVIILLEIWPMITLIRWRGRVRRGEMPDTTAAPTMATISWLQAGLVILMVFAATAMARGFGV